MPTGQPISERDRCCVLRMHAQGRFSKSEIAIACQLSRPVVIRIIDEFARFAWASREHCAEMCDLCDRE